MSKIYDPETLFESAPAADGDDDINLDMDDSIRNIDLVMLEDKLAERQSVHADHILDFCDSEHALIDKLHELIFARLDVLEADETTPKLLAEPATDFWLHVLEFVTDHVDAIEHKALK